MVGETLSVSKIINEVPRIRFVSNQFFVPCGSYNLKALKTESVYQKLWRNPK